jgi:hypothetical protein
MPEDGSANRLGTVRTGAHIPINTIQRIHLFWTSVPLKVCVQMFFPVPCRDAFSLKA